MNSTINRKKSKIIFYCCLLAFPVIQFCIFYIVVNVNSIIMAFQTYNQGVYEWAGFKNFTDFFSSLPTNGEFKSAIKNSFITIGVDFFLVMPLTLLFSFYIAKERTGHKFFRTILFLPTIISSMVTVLVYRYFLEDAVAEIIKMLSGKKPESFLFGSEDRRFFFLMLYHILVSFGTKVILFSGSMSGVSKDVIEAANLDGATGLKEFWHVSVPGVWPTVVVLTLATLTMFFTNQLGLFSFYGTGALNANVTIGYYLFKNTYGDLATMSVFPSLSAMGLIFTLIIAPITIGLKFVMEKYGPREE